MVAVLCGGALIIHQIPVVPGRWWLVGVRPAPPCPGKCHLMHVQCLLLGACIQWGRACSAAACITPGVVLPLFPCLHCLSHSHCSLWGWTQQTTTNTQTPPASKSLLLCLANACTTFQWYHHGAVTVQFGDIGGRGSTTNQRGSQHYHWVMLVAGWWDRWVDGGHSDYQTVTSNQTDMPGGGMEECPQGVVVEGQVPGGAGGGGGLQQFDQVHPLPYLTCSAGTPPEPLPPNPSPCR